jgi:hypothetical protein
MSVDLDYVLALSDRFEQDGDIEAADVVRAAVAELRVLRNWDSMSIRELEERLRPAINTGPFPAPIPAQTVTLRFPTETIIDPEVASPVFRRNP